jgi:hypothetical protein
MTVDCPAQIQATRIGDSLIVLGGAADDNIGFSNVNGDPNTIKMNDYATVPATPTIFTGVVNIYVSLGSGANVVQKPGPGFGTFDLEGDLRQRWRLCFVARSQYLR